MEMEKDEKWRKNIVLFCPRKDTVGVSFRPEVVYRAEEEGRAGQ